MMKPGSFGIIILAGGRGSRLGGQDKPGLVVGDDTLIASVARAGTGAGAGQIVVVGPERPGLDGVSFVCEEPPGAGPVPALRRGLAEAGAPRVAVLAADLPFLRASHLKALRAAAEGEPGAILVDDTGRPQWLAGCWATETLRRAVAGYHQDSLRGLLGPLAPVLVRLTPPPGEPPPWLDCDTPEDLRRARDLAGPHLPGLTWPGPGTRAAITRSDRICAVAQRQDLILVGIRDGLDIRRAGSGTTGNIQLN